MMGLLDSYQESTDTALAVMAVRPIEPDPPKPKHSAWTAPFRAVVAGLSEVTGNLGDISSAYAKNVPTPMFGQTDSASLIDAAKDFERDTGPDQFRNQVSQNVYQFGRDLRPDPMTAGTAENIVFGLTKGLTKAVGAAAALGPVGGAFAFGGSEGMTAAEDLANQGVDKATRTKVGAVTAAMNTAGVMIPVVGQTPAKTAALVAVGGPGSFIAQQAATREILRSADYGVIAEQYDPLDPVGLTVSTLVPAGFAAYAKRGWIGAKPSTKAEGHPAADGAASTQETGIPSTPEAIDAAMVHNLTIAQDAHQAASVSITEKNNGWIQAGSEFGTVGGTVKDGVLRITHADVVESERGKGYGVALYQSLIDEAHRRGFEVTSDVTVETPAARVYEALARRGYQVEKAQGSGVIEPDAMAPVGGLYGPGGDSPVFSVGAKKPVVKDSLTTGTEAGISAIEADKGVTPDDYAARVEALTKEQPDLIARLDEAGQPVKVIDELAAIKKQAQEGTDTDFGALDAPLLKVAAECALAIGTAGI